MVTLPGPDRYLSLDVFRGITITGMILVNNPGSWSYVYAPLRHAEWHGWTPTDLIFPFFLFIVGVAMVFAFEKRLQAGYRPADLYPKIIRRTLILFALGLMLNVIPTHLPEGYNFFRDTLAKVRIMGVLQRIAVVYFIASVLVLHFSLRGLVIWSSVLLAGYWFLMKWVPFSVYQNGEWVRYVGILDQEINLAAYVDNLILRGHTWIQGRYLHFDPEGILSTMPAVVTTLSGYLAGKWIRLKKDGYEKVSWLFFAGFLGVLAGNLLSYGFPVNKQLWSPSYVVLTSGMACIALAACIMMVDLKGWKAWTRPFVIFGTNALAYFVLAGVVGRLLLMIRVGAEQVSLKSWLFLHVFQPLFGAYNGSLAYAVTYILLWLGVMRVLYQKRIFIKI